MCCSAETGTVAPLRTFLSHRLWVQLIPLGILICPSCICNLSFSSDLWPGPGVGPVFLREVMGRGTRRALGRLGEKGGDSWSHPTMSPALQQPKPTKGRMRIHCLENVDKALQFLKEQKVHLENMGSHDIVDGNHRLTLGLVWTIILRFQVSSHGVTQGMGHSPL